MDFANARIASRARRNQAIVGGVSDIVTQVGSAAQKTVEKKKADEVQYRQALEARDAYVGVLNYANSLAKDSGKTIEGLGSLDAINYVNKPPKNDPEALKNYLENTPKLIDSAVMAIVQNPGADTTVIDGILKLPGYSADVRKAVLTQREQAVTGEVAGMAAEKTLRTPVEIGGQLPIGAPARPVTTDTPMGAAPQEQPGYIPPQRMVQPTALEKNQNPTREQFYSEAAKIDPGISAKALSETATGAQFSPAEKPITAYQRERLDIDRNYKAELVKRGSQRAYEDSESDFNKNARNLWQNMNDFSAQVDKSNATIQALGAREQEIKAEIAKNDAIAGDVLYDQAAKDAAQKKNEALKNELLDLPSKQDKAIQRGIEARNMELIGKSAWSLYVDADGRISYGEALRRAKADVEGGSDVKPKQGAGKPLTPEAVAEAKMKFPNDKEAARNWLISQGYNVQ
jgi:hypothetical protein